MNLGSLSKQPADVLDYDIDFSEWLRSGDTIETIDVVITRLDGAAIEVGDLAVKYTINNTPIVKVWLEKGVDGQSYKLEITVVTREGRTKQVELRARVRDY